MNFILIQFNLNKERSLVEWTNELFIFAVNFSILLIGFFVFITFFCIIYDFMKALINFLNELEEIRITKI